jgi:hypothetical protein
MVPPRCEPFHQLRPHPVWCTPIPFQSIATVPRNYSLWKTKQIGINPSHPEDWLNTKRLSTDWHFPQVTATFIQTLVTFQRRLIPPPFQMMANSLPVYQIFDKLSRRIHGHIIIVEESSDEEETVVKENDS